MLLSGCRAGDLLSGRLLLLASLIVHLVDFSRRFALAVVLVTLVAATAMGVYVSHTIKINTDIDQLMATKLDWRQREHNLAAAFPHKQDRLVIVVDGVNADAAEDAASRLADALSDKPDLFKTVSRPDNIPFFRHYGLLLLPEAALSEILDTLIKAQPMLGSLARDMSLRGLFSTLSLALEGVKRGETDYQTLAPSFNLIAETIEKNLNGQDTLLPWQSMMSDHQPTLRDTRKFIITQPVLDFSALSPGQKARDEVKQIATQLGLTPEHGVTVRQTGSVALNDEEFASVAEGTELATAASVLLVVLLLFLALKSLRLILPILLTLFVGLIATTAFAMAAVGSLNLISVAFAVMFVGIAVDFGIQFGVRLRDEHHKEPDTATAMRNTAKLIASPLTFAAASSTLGFWAFLPTDYRGVSELGLIAGAGMVIAYLLNLTLLPALLSLFKPPAEPEAVGYAWMAPLDRFIETKRQPLTYGLAALGLLAVLTASQIRFDYDPLNLKNPNAESVSTLFDIMKDPNASPYTIEILAATLDEAKQLAAKLDALPEVDHTITLASFIPDDQNSKLALIDDANFLLGPTINPEAYLIPPTPTQQFEAMSTITDKLRKLGSDKKEAVRLANAIGKIIEADDLSVLEKVQFNLLSGLNNYLGSLHTLLSAEAITLDKITPDLKNDWVTKDGRARIEVHPKGDARDPEVLDAFTKAVLAVAPEASGTAVSIQGSGQTVSSAFLEAGLLALLAIASLAMLVLRKIKDVIRLLTPLLFAGALTLATMVLIHLPLNFANIIALPLLLSLGVTYAIYFLSYWKDGQVNPLQSSMARAVLFSAGTTLVAFGSLSLSSHTGTRGMGELLTLALLYSVLGTFLVLPVLLDRSPSVKQ